MLGVDLGFRIENGSFCGNYDMGFVIVIVLSFLSMFEF